MRLGMTSLRTRPFAILSGIYLDPLARILSQCWAGTPFLTVSTALEEISVVVNLLAIGFWW